MVMGQDKKGSSSVSTQVHRKVTFRGPGVHLRKNPIQRGSSVLTTATLLVFIESPLSPLPWEESFIARLLP